MQHAASRTRGPRVRFEFDDDIAIDDSDRFAVAPDIANLQDAAVVDEVDDVRGEIGADDAGPPARQPATPEARRVRNECVSTISYRCWQNHQKIQAGHTMSTN